MKEEEGGIEGRKEEGRKRGERGRRKGGRKEGRYVYETSCEGGYGRALRDCCGLGGCG